MLFKSSTLIRLFAAAVALVILMATEFFLFGLSALGGYGAFLCAVVAPIVFAVRTPRRWTFIAFISACLALLLAATLALQLMEPSNPSLVSAKHWEPGRGMVETVPPTKAEAVASSATVGICLFAANFVALSLWKRIAIRSF